MKTHIMAVLIISGVLATSAVQATTSRFVEETYSGMSATEIQKDQQANPAAERHSTKGSKSTCAWLEPKSEVAEVADQLHAAYPGDEIVEKDYLATANFNFEC